jgi:hypothetical protein
LPGNIEVKVYMDGDVSNPFTRQVTLSGASNAVYKDDNDPFLEFGFSADVSLVGSIDIDFLSYAFGVIAPTAAGLDGDYNDDGQVDAADYVMFRKLFGTTSTLPNDPDVGTTIDQDQYDTWRENYGENVMGSGGGPVPEPASWALALSAAFALATVAIVRGPRPRCNLLS